LTVEDLNAPMTGYCTCCEHMLAAVTVAGRSLCLTCAPAFALDEPGIDDVATLIWLPHLDQGALSRCVTALHVAARATGHTVYDQSLSGQALNAKRAFEALLSCRLGALEKIGTDRPSLYRSALKSLSRNPLPETHETGLRILMRGTWFPDNPRRYLDAATEWAVSR
jgi:hypothetical protein